MVNSHVCAAVLGLACLAQSVDAAERNLLPNGGFEICGHLGTQRVEAQKKQGLTFDSADPLLPLRWLWNPGGTVDLRVASEAHSGQYALQCTCPQGGLEMEMQVIEVVPGATYSFGGWAKGQGHGRIAILGNAYEGRKELATVDLTLQPQWTETRKQLTIPGNIRTLTVLLALGGCEQTLVDDVFFSTDVEHPFDVDAVMTTKFQRDEHTLLLVDFDGSGQYRLESGAKLTEGGGGRFGRGVRLRELDVSSVVLPLELKHLPPEGTLEFWFSPDGDPEHVRQYVTVLAADQEVLWLDTAEALRVQWRIADDKQEQVLFRDPMARAVWLHQGEWHHVAVQWDREAVRLFVDGALARYSTARPLPFLKLPSAIKLGGTHILNAWSGVVDEVRLSDIRRYGPVVPAGAAWQPLVAAPQQAASAVPPTTRARIVSAPDFSQERQKLIGAIPTPPAGAIAFDASQIRPLLADDADFGILRDTPIFGMTVAKLGIPQVELLRMPDNDGGYWRLSGVPPGSYSVGVWYESSSAGLEAPQQMRARLWVYLNGRAVQLSTHSDPVQVAPGVYYAEAQSQGAETLKDGDEIAVLPVINQPVRVARLVLYPHEPARGHGWMFENYGANIFSRDTALRLNAFCGFRIESGKGLWNLTSGMDLETESPDSLKKTADGQALAFYKVANPLSVPLVVKARVEIKAYFRELVGSQETTFELAPHQRVTREVPFTLLADSRRYSMDVQVSAVDPPALGWPTADTISFFPGVRQSVPWPDPFQNEFRRCISFRRPLPGVRQSVSLNGPWESAFTPLPTQPPVPAPADLKWEPRTVPFHVGGHEQKAHGLYVRRKFTLTKEETERTWRLLIKEVIDDATAYVNGQQVGRVRGCRTPLFCDITAAIRPGENEILLVVRDALANMDPAYVNPHNPVVSYQYLDVPGTGFAHAFAVGHTKLLSSPRVSAEDLQVQTSVRSQAVTARFQVANRDAAARKLNVQARVLAAGRPVLDVGEAAAFELPAGTRKSLTLAAPWAKPVCWGPNSPQLYTLAVEVTDAQTGQRVDLLKERFGFRECWVENGRIILNGAPVRLKGSNCGGGGGILPGDDVQWTRGSDGAEDFLDEFGCLAGFYTLGGLGNTPSRHNVERDLFWELETKNVLAGAAQYVNHPCLIAWDLSNEWLSFLSYGGGDPLFGARRFKAVGDALTAYDPSRWILFDGDGDLHGLWDTFAEHYMLPSTGKSHSSYLPDSRFWRKLDQDFRPAEARSAYNANTVYRSDLKAIMNTENAWKVDGLQPPGLSVVVGEDDVLSPAVDSGRGPIVWYWKQNVDGHRDLGASIVCNYTTVTGLNRRGHMLQCFIIPQHVHHGFGGQKFQARYSLHNDLLVPSEYDFRWRLADAQGTGVADGHDARRMQSGDMQRGVLTFDLPQVPRRTRYTLRLDLLADGKFAYGEQRDIDVWPDAVSPFPTPARKIVLFDPAGRTAPVFTKAGMAFTPVDQLSVPDGPASGTVLVLGEGAVQSNREPAAAPLSNFVAAGGRIVALRQENLLPGVPVQTTLEKREWCSLLFTRTPQHPLLQGIDAWDLQFWAPDHVTAQGSYSRPDSGSFVTLLDGCSDHDRAGRSATEWVQLMECYRGQGSYLLCQLPLAEKYDVEPMARELLARLIAYAAGASSFRQPTQTLRFVGDPVAAVASKLRDMGVAFRTVEIGSPLEAEAVMLVDVTSLPAAFTAPAAWKTALADGATIAVHGASPAQQPLLAALADRPVAIHVQPYAMWEGRGYRNGFTGLAPGLSHVDLYWKQYAGDEGAVAQAEQPKYKIEDLCYWSVQAEGAVEHVFPGAVVEIPVGRGRLIVDQIRWETANQKLTLPSRRVVSALMTGLGVAIAPYVPARKLPPETVYKPLDLSLFCNRGFKDEVGDDGQGGWSDQGPAADLREFPTGSQSFGGVPFAVMPEPTACLVLRSSQRPFPERTPAEVTIPVGFPVEGLCFLHSATYCGEGSPGAVYQVQYADGTSQEIRLVSGENIRDWTAPPAEFARERGTRSRVAWTGTTQLFPVVSVFQMLWVNPQPDLAVKAVRFSNPGQAACPILIAITAAVTPGKVDLEALAAAQAKANEWLQAGLAAVRAGQDAEAGAAFRQAIQEDPKLDAAHQGLGEWCERTKNEEATLAAYRAWASVGPRTPLPYNKLGEILERRQDDRGALAAYTKSLEVEWNQPPVIEAKSRLMLRVKD